MEGQISNYQYTEIGRKKDSYSVTFNMMSSLGSYNITLMVNKLGNADCSIRGNWPGELNYHGKLVPLEQSRVYKGTPVY